MENLQVRMIHNDLSEAPIFDCPPPYRIQPYKPGFEEAWLNIHRQADQLNIFTPFVFGDQFGHDEKLLEERQLYLFDDRDNAVGTATAWTESRGQYSGRVHWVAIVPQHQGRGLSKSLLSSVCQKLLAMGHRQGCLSTSTARIPAINLYLQFGFRPLIQSDEDEVSWSLVETEGGIRLPL